MDAEYIKHALCFHGPPMQKIWENERGSEDLPRIGISGQPIYDIYQQRQKFFTFQDRAKRLKLHQFIARKAKDLYDGELKKYANVLDEKHLEKVKKDFTIVPPYEHFAYDTQDKTTSKSHIILESLKPGDIIYGIVKNKTAINLQIKPLCTAEPLVRCLHLFPLKGFVLQSDMGTASLSEGANKRGYASNDIVCCELLRVSTDVDRLFLGFDGVYTKDSRIKLGVVDRKDLPLYYDTSKDCTAQKYEEFLEKSKEFLNPNYDVLYRINGLDSSDTFSLMGSLKQPFPVHDYAKELRRAQAHKWAFRSVAEGIELFKTGKHLEAFQCLNKALNIDPHNVEGLVARGALFANRGSFQKAVDDFRTALNLDGFHANARKYMGETLVALGRSLEDDQRFDEAAKAYKDCLEIIPNHIQAHGCLEALNLRTSNLFGNNVMDSSFFDLLSNVTASEAAALHSKATQNQLEILSSSEDGSSDSDTSNSDSNTNTNNHSQFQKEASLSPLSKRMALHAASMRASAAMQPGGASTSMMPQLNNQFNVLYNQPYLYNDPQTLKIAPDEFKLDDDDDTGTRVQKLLKQASEHKKEKKSKQKRHKKNKKKLLAIKEAGGFSETLFQNNYLQQAFNNVKNVDFDKKLNQEINCYEQKIADINKRQTMLRQSLAHDVICLDESPPPPPSMKFSKIETDLKSGKGMSNQRDYSKPSTSSSKTNATLGNNKLSFQIRKPVKIDIFGMARCATPSPIKQRSVSRSRSRSRRRDRRSRTKSTGRRDGRRRYSISRSRSRSSSYRRSRRSSSYKRSRSRSSRSCSYKRYGSTRSKSRSRRSRKNEKRSTRSPKQNSSKNSDDKFGNRSWQRPSYMPPEGGNELWKHNKFETNKQKGANDDDGPTIEEIDEIINQAQKDRKAEIIKRDKTILKKTV